MSRFVSLPGNGCSLDVFLLTDLFQPGWHRMGLPEDRFNVVKLFAIGVYPKWIIEPKRKDMFAMTDFRMGKRAEDTFVMDPFSKHPRTVTVCQVLKKTYGHHLNDSQLPLAIVNSQAGPREFKKYLPLSAMRAVLSPRALDELSLRADWVPGAIQDMVAAVKQKKSRASPPVITIDDEEEEMKSQPMEMEEDDNEEIVVLYDGPDPRFPSFM